MPPATVPVLVAYAWMEVLMVVRTRNVPTVRAVGLARPAVAGLIAAVLLAVGSATAAGARQPAGPAGSLAAPAATAPAGSTGVTFEVLPRPSGSPTPHPSKQPLPVTGSNSGPGPLLALAALLVAAGAVLALLGRRRMVR
ncbi:hypothetical protein ACQPYA_03010 [Micromonospora sp. CA-263727]|uniref:hypothetical protein n=1 Tax=Micromonospora sp. CA-263727 TaxID=3239967 RepID=UPI003D8B5417